MTDILTLQKDWLKKEKQKIESTTTGRKQKRQYLHFDKRIAVLEADLLQKVWSSEFIAKYPFYPFVRAVKSAKHYKRIPGTQKCGLSTKKRPIDYAAHFDALIFAWYTHILSTVYERKVRELGVSENAIAYRQLDGKNNVDFAKEVFNFIDAHPGFVAIAFDVEKFFENLDHRRLKNLWKELLEVGELPPDHYAVFKAVTKFRYTDITQLRRALDFSIKDQGRLDRICSAKDFREKVVDGGLLQKHSRKNEKTGAPVGIPQGSPISCVLSNLYMLPFDYVIAEVVKEVGGLYRRYSDDIIIVVPAERAEECEARVLSEIEKIGLNINNSKTERVKFVTEGAQQVARDWEDNARAKLQYLGIEFDGEVMKLRHAGLARFQRRRSRSVRNLHKWAEENKKPLPKKVLISKYTRKGGANYLTYADRTKKALGSKVVGRQTAESKVIKQLKRQMSRR